MNKRKYTVDSTNKKRYFIKNSLNNRIIIKYNNKKLNNLRNN